MGFPEAVQALFGELFVSVLRPVFGDEDAEAGRQVGRPDRGTDLVDVLATGAAAADRLVFDLVFL